MSAAARADERMQNEPIAPRPASEFSVSPEGKIYKTPENVRTGIEKLGVTLRYDEFAKHAIVIGLAGHGPRLDDAACSRLRFAMDEEFHFLPSKDLAFDVIVDHARRNAFHPVREYLATLKWDRTRRIDTLFSSYGGAEDSAYTRAVSRLILVAAVRRVRQPGCKFDEMPILEGPQGIAKSTWLRTLAVQDEWFGDSLPLGADDKKLMEATAGKWLTEAPELKGMSRSDVGALKAYLSRQVDEARLSYARMPTVSPRQFVIIGTTNELDGYLRDTTGNRRYWPVRIVGFDLERTR